MSFLVLKLGNEGRVREEGDGGATREEVSWGSLRGLCGRPLIVHYSVYPTVRVIDGLRHLLRETVPDQFRIEYCRGGGGGSATTRAICWVTAQAPAPRAAPVRRAPSTATVPAGTGCGP